MKEVLKKFATQVEERIKHINTEEATKTSLILPFFSEVLGYDVYNPTEFTAEFVADISKKKGEKVDYAILKDGVVEIIVEAKPHTTNLRDRQTGQLQRYFHTTEANVGILTNGIEYLFFTDAVKPNVMDDEPFLTLNILNNDKRTIRELQKFVRQNYDRSVVINTAADLKIQTQLKEQFESLLSNPSDDFIRLCIKDIHSGSMRQSVFDEYRPKVKEAFNAFINDQTETILVRASNMSNSPVEEQIDIVEPVPVEKVQTTDAELELFNTVKGMLMGIEEIDVSNIYYRDTESYLNIMYSTSRLRWFVRGVFQKKQITIIIRMNNQETPFRIQSLSEIGSLKHEIRQACIAQMRIVQK